MTREEVLTKLAKYLGITVTPDLTITTPTVPGVEWRLIGWYGEVAAIPNTAGCTDEDAALIAATKWIAAGAREDFKRPRVAEY